MNEERYIDVARRMQLIHQGPAAGVVYWQPAGLSLYERLRSYIRGVHRAHGYREVKTPGLVGLELFERSGHLGKYRENMFLVNQSNDAHSQPELSSYGLRPMSCPNHIELYSSSRRSYRELPLALFEFGEVFRNEPSGSLQLLFRQRQFCQDDSHVFAAQSQVAEVASRYLVMAQKVFADLGFEAVEYALSLRPAERFGSDAQWGLAEESLREAFRHAGVSWKEQPGEGAFYGPKVELGVRDKLGRLWQMGTLQLDYVLPERFDLAFQASGGEFERPVLLHHAVLGSLERMIGILLEVHGEKLPAFLHPYPAVVVAVSEKSEEYARQVHLVIQEREPEALFDASQDTLGAKLKHWRSLGVASIFVVGEQEAQLYEKSGEVWAMKSEGRKQVATKLA